MVGRRFQQAMRAPRRRTSPFSFDLHARCAERAARLIEQVHAARKELAKLRREIEMSRRCARCEQSKTAVAIAHGDDYGYWAGKPLCLDCHWDRLWLARHNHQTAVEMSLTTLPASPSQRQLATVVSLPIRRQISRDDSGTEVVTLPTSRLHRNGRLRK
jgi:hypothetical protein